jgi:hypothetical protein
MSNFWMGNKGQMMRGGNSASPQVQQGRQALATSAIMRAYANMGGRYNTDAGGRPTVPTYRDNVTGETRVDPKFEQAMLTGLTSMGDQNIGTGMTGRGAAAAIIDDRARFTAQRRAEQDRGFEMEQRDEVRRENQFAEEGRNWTREMWNEARGVRRRGGGAGVGGNFGVQGLR